MPAYRTATVVEILDERPGLQRLLVDLGADPERAFAISHLTGPVAVGDRVIVNTTAVDLGLGSGGWHIVHWNLARDSWVEPGAGHVMKLRYTSLQTDVGCAEEVHAERLADVDDLDGLPVVACGLHSQLGPVAAAFAHSSGGARLVYVMTDGGALPLALSDQVAGLRAAGLLAGTITAGHAFGGDHEAVNVPSALAVARQVLDADAVVVAMGPGVVGTATRLGFTALEVGAVVDVTALLGGQPVAALRVSLADERLRHLGLSHHSRTALGIATRTRAVLPVPRGELEARIRADLDAAGLSEHHRVMAVDVPDVPGLLAAVGLEVRSMGRTADDDPAFWKAAGAAGVAAERLLQPRD